MNDQVILAGNLDFLNLGDLMQLLGGNGSSGTLRLLSRYASGPGFIYFENGNPINASNGKLVGLEALYSLFGWTEGEFEFTRENFNKERLITKSRMGVILDGLRMLDDGQIEKLGPATMGGKEDDATDIQGGIPMIRGPLVDYMYIVEEEDFYEGDAIVEEGKHGSWIWVILEGVVEITKEAHTAPLPIMRVSDGSFVGSMASFLVQANTRNATATALGNVQLGVLDSQRLAQEYSRMSPEFRNFIISLDRRLRQVTNRCVEIHDRTVNIDDYVKNKKPVIRQGNPEERLFQIRQGRVSIVKETEAGQVPLIQLQQGDFCGHVPFIDHGLEPDGASVLATDDFKVAALDAVKLKQDFDRASSMFRNIIQNVAACIAATSVVACNFYEDVALNPDVQA